MPTDMRLLDRQTRLLGYLTSSSAIFGDDADIPQDQVVRGFDRRSLRLEARFSHEKRMEKIIAVFPKTFRLLGADRAVIIREFVASFPPTNIARIDNARQFYECLSTHWRTVSQEPPYLADVAACEFAFAKVRSGVGLPDGRLANGRALRCGAVRRRYDIALLRCAYNVRSIFEDDAQEPALIKRDTRLAIAIPPGAEQPQIFEVHPSIFEFLVGLDDWIDQCQLGAASGLELDGLISELARRGLVEVHI
jgi:hypothetical protein